MKSFIYGLLLHFRLDLRNKDVLITYYLVPLAFFFLMGGIFSYITPESKSTLTGSMVVFAITMGSALGTPIPLIEHYGGVVRKAFQAGGIPIWAELVWTFVSGFFHLGLVAIFISTLAPLVFNADAPVNLPAFIAGLVVFLSTSLLVGCLFGLLVKTTAKLTLLSQALFLPSVLLAGIMFPSSYLPGFLQKMALVLPATWGFKALTASQLSWANLWPLLLISAMCLAAIAWRLRSISESEP